jgi:hypothetical protein
VRGFTTDEKTNSALEVTYRGWLLELTPVTLPVVRLTTIGADYIDTRVSPSVTYLGDPGFVMGNAGYGRLRPGLARCGNSGFR